MKDVLVVLLAGGVGQRLHPLTRDRAKPAVPFGGLYRIIDSTLSNCVNSGCPRVQVLVQYKSLSLVRHIRFAWNLMRPELNEFIEVIPPQQRINNNWYLGTADAIYQNLYSIEREKTKEVLILSGDHIYKMNYNKMLDFHREIGAEMTIAAIETPVFSANQFGILETDRDGRVSGFEEKPEHPKPLPEKPDMALASMGIYVFHTDLLKQVCKEDAESNSAHDFGKDIIPRLVQENRRVFTYTFEDENKKEAKYWRDIGTLDAYWEANMDLVAIDPLFNLYDEKWPLRTKLPIAPPAKFVFDQEGGRYGVALNSIVSPGCIISGGMVKRSVLSPNVYIHSYSHVEESILFDGVSVGRYARLRRVIAEKNVRIPEGAVIGYDLQEDAKRFRVTNNNVVVVENVESED